MKKLYEIVSTVESNMELMELISMGRYEAASPKLIECDADGIPIGRIGVPWQEGLQSYPQRKGKQDVLWAVRVPENDHEVFLPLVRHEALLLKVVDGDHPDAKNWF